MYSWLHRKGAPSRYARPARTRLNLLNLEGRIVPRATAFQVTDLVADQPGVGGQTDAHLVNPWGLAVNPTGAFWVANNGTNTATLYTGDVGGSPLMINSLVVTLPGGAPTGQVFNNTDDFMISSGEQSAKAAFLFVTEAGEIVGWSPTVPGPAPSTSGIIAATVDGAIFKGLAIAQSGGANYIYATDFHNGKIDVFDSTFDLATLSGDFTDPRLPAGYAPFNIMAFNDKLYVTYAVQDDTGEDEVAGVGKGIVDVFNTDGTFDKRLVQHGLLNAPWGMAVAPTRFGSFAGALLVGNFGDGRIDAYDIDTGHFRGTLRDPHGQKVAIDGLWGLAFGNGATAGDANTLYFTAGADDEMHGVFGSIRMTPSQAPPPIEAIGQGEGGAPFVKVFEADNGRLMFDLLAYDRAFQGGVRVAVGDVNGDGTLDFVTAAGTGGGPHIKVFDGTDGHLISQFMAYDQNFRGGVNVAVGDVDGDGLDDIITGADTGGGPHVKVFSGADGSVLRVSWPMTRRSAAASASRPATSTSTGSWTSSQPPASVEGRTSRRSTQSMTRCWPAFLPSARRFGAAHLSAPAMSITMAPPTSSSAPGPAWDRRWPFTIR